MSEHGKLLFKTQTDAISPVSMYIVATFGFLLGIGILIPSAPMLISGRPGDPAAGAAGSFLALILIGGGIGAVIAARSRQTVYKIAFYTNGIAYAKPKRKPVFYSYQELHSISCVIRTVDPKSKEQLKGVAGIAAIAGNAGMAGAAASLQKAAPSAFVFIGQDAKKKIKVESLSIEQVKQISKYATKSRQSETLKEEYYNF